MLLPGQYKGTRKRLRHVPRTLSQIMEWNFKLPKGSIKILGEKMPDRDKYFQSGDWLSPKDVKNGQLLQIEEFGEAKTRIGLRPYVRFKGFDAPFGLNATNFDDLIAKFGEKEKDWQGKKVKVKIVMAANPQKGGKEQPAIRFE